ncbi:metal-dependent hydrolase [Allochromatium palmeri]|uniref:Metal-dependent hydrolase n=1 Tax=Allochromatium palmeri TaxID=231048 RepID=A0A6N8E8U2_9GAMM|nr:metal-dependent hydrolase [Allochromatium palmeri]MTW20693.1 metal-dependent hydrolase [Allochromatium palmeri]
MANFQTHLNVGILVSAAATLSLHVAGVVEQSPMPVLFVLGVAGSLLPDIDLERSKPTSLLFNVLGAVLAFAVTLPLTARFQPLVLAAIWAIVFLAVRYGVLKVFSSFTIHRGVWHSWLAIAAVSLATTNLAYWGWEHSAERAWIAGLMVGIGYLTHLVLDEFSSVDLFNAKIKRSFGTALKPISLKYPWSTIAMAGVLAALISVAPPVEGVLEQLDLDPQATLVELETWLREGTRWAVGHLSEWWERLSQPLAMQASRG